ncbi:MAG TPA: hypothetical protein VNO32_37100, partial [Candidatus Acidoferrum sp.]|nr:hypothetical protein [Candidatus Acidoferrum sp.]
MHPTPFIVTCRVPRQAGSVDQALPARSTWTINASSLSQVVRQVALDGHDGINSGALSIDPFGGS